jgi:hypothetical protein
MMERASRLTKTITLTKLLELTELALLRSGDDSEHWHVLRSLTPGTRCG